MLELYNPEFAPYEVLSKGFETYLAECSGCDIVGKPEFLLSEIGPELAQKTSNALISHPDASILQTPVDAVAAAAAQGVVTSGRTGSVATLGAGGDSRVIELIRADRGVAMTVGQDWRWVGWIAMDDVARILAGEKPVDSGFAFGLVDQDHLPEGDRYNAPVDYQALYTGLWEGDGGS